MGRELESEVNVIERSQELVSEGRYEEDAEFLERALEAHPASVTIRLWAAHAAGRNDPRRGIERIEEVVSASPDDPYLLVRAASILFDLAAFDLSRTYIRRTSQLASEDFELAPAAVHIAGKLALQKGDTDLAKRLLATAFEEDPGVPGHGSALAELHLSAGNYLQAREVLDEALRHLPDDPTLLQLAESIRQASAEQ